MTRLASATRHSELVEYLFSAVSPMTQSRFPIRLKSFVHTWITTASGLPRSLISITLCSCSVQMPEKHSNFISGHSVPTFRIIDSPNTKHSPPLWHPGAFSLLPTSLSAVDNRNSSSNTLFFLVRSSIWSTAFCSFSFSSQSLVDLHLSQIHFPLSATWALTLQQLLWNQRLNVLYWVPDLRFM